MGFTNAARGQGDDKINSGRDRNWVWPGPAQLFKDPFTKLTLHRLEIRYCFITFYTQV
ncbi:hypothetical protein Oscil6304_4790 [Oscillatoria acuminata PCC 6304]|uniref:Uncharacterized protein n=1 Tax=Oscillatoria acuminata PCC 6304 TaxID=56110 RepID=K9TP45_9CYAN|nr:hypothetical protein Oscil6304_4790 [Oscillatoria acuminata PCC 6304]